MDPRFVSIGVETWEWLFDPDALDNAVLRQVVAALAPLVIRVGGISADQTRFMLSPFPKDTPWPPVVGPYNLLNASTFDRLVSFCRGTGASLIFDLDEMLGRSFLDDKGVTPDPNREPFLLQPPLNLSGVEALLQHASRTGALAPTGPLFAVELGNELTPHILDVRTQAADYCQMRGLLDAIFPPSDSGGAGHVEGGLSPATAAPLLYGPATCSCENMSSFLTLAGPARLDAFTFHAYPLSGAGDGLARALVDPSRLRTAIPAAMECYAAARRQANSSVPFFMSETNSDSSTFANSGQATFLNGFWYMSSLGAAALQGMALHVRWKLWNPRVSYRPGALTQTFGFLDKALAQAIPDLWVALLHKRLIGGGAPLHAGGNDTDVLVWAHRSHQDPASESVVVMMANPQTHPVNVTMHFNASAATTTATTDAPRPGCQREYILSRGPGGANATTACLNDEHCRTPLLLAEDGSPPAFPAREVAWGTPVHLPAVSYGFVVAEPGACTARG